MSENYPNPNVVDPAMRQHVPGGEHQLSPEDAVLAAAREVVDQAAGDVAKDAPAGQPLPEHTFTPEEAVAEATSVAMREGLAKITTVPQRYLDAASRDRFSTPAGKWRESQLTKRPGDISFITKHRAFGGGAPKSQPRAPETGSDQVVD